MDKHNATLRIILDIVLGAAIVFGWWYVAIPLAILGAWVFPRYLELLIFAFMHDMLFDVRSVGFSIATLFYMLGALVILLVMHMIKVAVRE